MIQTRVARWRARGRDHWRLHRLANDAAHTRRWRCDGGSHRARAGDVVHAIVIVVIVIVVIDARALVQQLLQQLLRLLSNVLEQRRLCRELAPHASAAAFDSSRPPSRVSAIEADSRSRRHRAVVATHRSTCLGTMLRASSCCCCCCCHKEPRAPLMLFLMHHCLRAATASTRPSSARARRSLVQLDLEKLERLGAPPRRSFAVDGSRLAAACSLLLGSAGASPRPAHIQSPNIPTHTNTQ